MFGLNPDSEYGGAARLENGAGLGQLKWKTAHAYKSSAEWQEQCWVRWRTDDDWPFKLDVYEAAAYLRVSSDSIRRAMVTGRDGRAKLSHQRVGSVYRIRRGDLDNFGRVEAR